MKKKASCILFGHAYIAMVFLLFIFVGCTSSCTYRYAGEELTRADEVMEQYPDSAYSILSTIDKTKLRGRESRAKYALLMSAAMDKNYIDTTTFDVLQPAIDYYLKTGSPDNKLKTYYYQGRILQNQGDLENALASFTKASEISGQCSDSIAVARNCMAIGYLCFDFFKFDNSVDNYLEAAEIFKSMYREDMEVDCLLSALNVCNISGNKDVADSIIMECEKFKTLDESQFRKLQNLKLLVAVNYGTPQEIMGILGSGPSDDEVATSGDAFGFALAYNSLGCYDRALQMLELVDKANIEYDTLRYMTIAVNAFVGLDDYKNAFTTYSSFSEKADSLALLRFDRQTELMQDRYELERTVEKEKNIKSKILWGCIGGLVFFSLVIFLLLLSVKRNKIEKELSKQKQKARELENSRLLSQRANMDLKNKNLQLELEMRNLENENLAHKIEILENERESLNDLIRKKDELPLEVQAAIKERVEMLNSLLASEISDNDKYAQSYANWIKDITADSDKFMNSNRLAFQASHPEFIKYFENAGLDVGEINYVCLYAIGLKGKEVGNFMKKRSHVNISSAIRKKLGIDVHETNIGIYVRKLLKSL